VVPRNQHDSFRNRVERDGDRVRLITRGGLDEAISLDRRKRLLARKPEGIFVNPFGRGEIGPVPRAPCGMGLEGLVSKRRDRPYQAGRSKHWLKGKNRKHPAMERVMDSFETSDRTS
jgi:hypothetical protein